MAWLLREFPTKPMPQMLLPLEQAELVRYRDDLAERMRKVAVP
jgi:hypothetical protein